MVESIELKSKEQAAAFLGLSIQTLNRIVKRDELTPVRIGKYVRFRPTDLYNYVNKLSEPASAPQLQTA